MSCKIIGRIIKVYMESKGIENVDNINKAEINNSYKSPNDHGDKPTIFQKIFFCSASITILIVVLFTVLCIFIYSSITFKGCSGLFGKYQETYKNDPKFKTFMLLSDRNCKVSDTLTCMEYANSFTATYNGFKFDHNALKSIIEDFNNYENNNPGYTVCLRHIGANNINQDALKELFSKENKKLGIVCGGVTIENIDD